MFSACFLPVTKYCSIGHTKCLRDSKRESSVEWKRAQNIKEDQQFISISKDKHVKVAL